MLDLYLFRWGWRWWQNYSQEWWRNEIYVSNSGYTHIFCTK